MRFDTLDRKILEVLQEDATLAVADLAERAGSSKSAVWRRMQALLESGVIDRRVAVLNPKKIGFNITILALVKLARPNANALPNFIEAVKAMPQVVECHTTLGQVDVVMKILVADIDEYRDLVWSRLSQLDVHEISSLISFEQSICRTTLVPK